MKPKRPAYGFLYFLGDFILVIELIFKLRTGKLSESELFIIIILTIVSAIPVLAFMRKKMGRNNRNKTD